MFPSRTGVQLGGGICSEYSNVPAVFVLLDGSGHRFVRASCNSLGDSLQYILELTKLIEKIQNGSCSHYVPMLEEIKRC